MTSLAYKTPRGKLRESGARRILELRKTGRTYQQIAEEMRVSIGTVYNICKGRTWEFLEDAIKSEVQ